MTESPRIEGLLRRIGREIRRRRAEYYGLRGAFWGAVAGVAILLAKHALAVQLPINPATIASTGRVSGYSAYYNALTEEIHSRGSLTGRSVWTTVSRRRSSGPTARTARRS